MAKPLLTDDDFCRAAKRLKCEVAAIKAVADTESRGQGFYADGFPVILYERHIFRKYTDGKFNKSHPELSGPQGNYGAAGANQRRKFSAAFALDPIAAMKACSWGKFQLMGFNWKVCGFTSVGAMIDAMKESEGRHLEGFVSFVKGNRLDDEIREKDWAGFAYGYNGSGYRVNKYDTKMAAAYKKFTKEDVDCSNTAIEMLPSPVVPDGSVEIVEQTIGQDEPTEITEHLEQTTEETSEGTKTNTVFDKVDKVGDKLQSLQGTLDKFGFSIEDAKRSLGTVLLTWGKVIFGVIMAGLGVIFDHWEYFLIAGLALGLGYLLWERSGKRVADAKAGVPADIVKEALK